MVARVGRLRVSPVGGVARTLPHKGEEENEEAHAAGNAVGMPGAGLAERLVTNARGIVV